LQLKKQPQEESFESFPHFAISHKTTPLKSASRQADVFLTYVPQSCASCSDFYCQSLC